MLIAYHLFSYTIQYIRGGPSKDIQIASTLERGESRWEIYLHSKGSGGNTVELVCLPEGKGTGELRFVFA